MSDEKFRFYLILFASFPVIILIIIHLQKKYCCNNEEIDDVPIISNGNIVETIKIETLNDLTTYHDEANCTICLTPLINNNEVEDICIIDGCKHSYHLTCLHNWVVQNRTCPICRLQINSIKTKMRC